jgi:hypothetical protein
MHIYVFTGAAPHEEKALRFSKMSAPRGKISPRKFKNAPFHRFFLLHVAGFAPYCMFMRLCSKYAKWTRVLNTLIAHWWLVGF